MFKKLGVYILTYNRLQYLKKTIQCVLNQTYKDFDFYIVDNNSDDGTQEYIESLKNININYIRHEKNLGGLLNIKYAFEHNKNEYFIMLHDDDIFDDKLLEVEVNYLDNHKTVSCVTCDSYVIDVNDKILVKTERSNRERHFSIDGYLRFFVFERKSLCFPTTMYRNSFFKNGKQFFLDEAGPCMDVVFYMNVERYGGTTVFIPEHLYSSRAHEKQDSQVNHFAMYVKLMKFLYTDKYYADKFEKNRDIDKAYFRFNTNFFLIRLFKGFIGYEYVCEVYKCIDENLPRIYFCHYRNKVLLKLYHLCPNLIKFLYNVFETRIKRKV